MASNRPPSLPLWAKRRDDPNPPDGWQEAPLVAIADIRFSNVDKKSYVSETPVRLCNYTDVYNKEYVHGHEDFMHATASEGEIARFAVAAGDVIITKDSETPDDIGVPAVVLSAPKDLLCGYHLALIRPRTDEVNPVFLAKQIAHARISRYYARLANGLTRYGLTNAVVEFTPVWLPESEEQRRAAEVLRGLDETIVKTEALIAKLKAVKQGLLHDLLSRGLDENGELRDPEKYPDRFRRTPLGFAPAKWRDVPLGLVGTWSSGGTPSKTVPAYWNGPIPWLTPKDMKSFDVVSTTDTITEAGAVNGTSVAPAGSVFIVVRGMILAHSLPICLSCQPMAFNQDIRAVKCGQSVHPRFLSYWLTASTARLLSLVEESSHGTKRFDTKRLFAQVVAIPEPSEQSEIILRLDAHARRISSETEYLGKLSALKKGLMQDLLTGRVRVSVGKVPASATG